MLPVPRLLFNPMAARTLFFAGGNISQGKSGRGKFIRHSGPP